MRVLEEEDGLLLALEFLSPHLRPGRLSPRDRPAMGWPVSFPLILHRLHAQLAAVDQRLAGWRELAHGQLGGPVGSIRGRSPPPGSRWPPRFGWQGHPSRACPGTNTMACLRSGSPLGQQGGHQGHLAVAIPRFCSSTWRGLRNPLPERPDWLSSS